MIKNIIFAFIFATFVGQFGLMVVSPSARASSLYFADSKSLACDGATLIDGGDCNPETDTSATDLALMITTIFAWVLGILSVIFIIYGGFKYVTESGRPGGDGVASGVASAKNTIIYAVIGLVVAMIAQPLVKFVIGYFS